ncbi:hypothetical protein B0A55_02465 [Friedmanniomyces simplex]|uniref:Uncharacterized protein n=1 Tax=Friedmanniomyces simplex TaxID=329884 RepID=A0A4V5NHR4_9PEZI|nr:hypothetical protein B0A55_02465 [Friedmanniomyces simplex]
MEAIKSAVGFGKKEQEGQEPVSGVKGEGTAGEPYDSGNQQGDSELGGKAPQETDPSKVTGQAPVDDKAAAAVDSTTTSGKSEEPIAYDPVPAATSASASAPATNESETSKATGSSESKEATIGSTSWFKTAIPFGRRKGDESAGQSNGGHQATAGALDNGAAKEVSGMDESGLPPNHLGANVPVGTSTEPVDTPTNETTSKDTMTPTNAATPAQGGEAATHDTAPVPTTAHPQTSIADTHAKTATEQPQQYVAEGEPSQQQQQTSSGGGGLFSNPFSSSSKKMENEAPPSLEKRRLSREAYGSNPNATPTAGGKRVGSVAFEQRGKSMDARRSGSLTQPSVPDEKEEKEGEGTTSAAGRAGGAAAAPNVSSSAERARDIMTAETAANSVPPPVSSPSTTSAAAKTDEAPPRASLSPSEGREHSRRKSIFDKFKDKLPGHHHKEH